MPVDFHPRAIEDARAARRWYARRSPGVALRFMNALDRAIEQVAAAPGRWPAYLHGTRAFRLRRFPYFVVDHELDAAIQVVAVAHGKRRPGYWRRRLP